METVKQYREIIQRIIPGSFLSHEESFHVI